VVVRLVAAVWAAEDHARGGNPPPQTRLSDVVSEAYDAASGVCDTAGYAGYAAAHAARSAIYATEFAAGDEGAFMEALASSFGATLVLRNHCGSGSESLVRAALRADFDTLVRLRLGEPGTDGAPIDPAESGPLGPLWPAGTPAWFVA
jgi:hypothetical protein